MNGNELRYVEKAFEENWIAPYGPNITGFEREICDYIGVGNGVALSSGTAAIHLALRYLGVGRGDRVFCSDLTFSASCNPIKYEHACPVFIDSEYDSSNMCPKALEKALESAAKNGKLPKAVIIVDLYGQSANFDELLPVCEEYGVPVIEDAAEALGCEYKGKKCGSFGKIGILSFNGNKIITTSGGGMAISDDKNIIRKMQFWANQSKEQETYYLHKELGFNYRISNICAGIGRGQLLTIDEKIDRRKAIFNHYKKAFADLPVDMFPTLIGCEPNYWLSVLTIKRGSGKKPEDIIGYLEENNIESRRVWNPMHCQPFFKDCEYFTADGKSVSSDLFERGICMPSGSGMTNEDLERVCHVFTQAFGG